MNYSALIIKECIEDEKVFFDCLSRIHEKMFPLDADKVLWNAMLQLSSKNIKLSVSALKDILKKNTEKDAYNELMYISKLDREEQQLGYCIYRIREDYNCAVLKELGTYITTHTDGDIESGQIISYSEKLLYNLEETSIEDITVTHLVDKTVDNIEKVQRGESSIILKTGLLAIDNRSPFVKEQQVLIAADNGTGKTALMIQLIKNFFKYNNDIAIYMVSLDVTAEKIMRRMICNEVGIQESAIIGRDNQKLTREQIDQIRAFRDQLKNDSRYALGFLDRDVNMSQIVSKAKKFIKQHSDRHIILILDNIDKVRNDGLDVNAQQGLVSGMMLGMMREHGTTNIILHHLTKEHQKNIAAGERPSKKDIRGSGKLTDDPDMIWLLFRPDNYPDLIADDDSLRGVMQIISEKSRDDNKVVMEIGHQIELYRFFNLTDSNETN